MEPTLLERLRRSFAGIAERSRGTAPVLEALCEGLGAGPSPAVADVFSRYFRIISAMQPNVAGLLGGLHRLALTGEAPALAAFFPSCGGRFEPEQRPALVAAAEAALAANRDDVLDFMLSWEGQLPPDPQRAAAVALGAMTAVQRLGGGLSLVELGCGAGLNLLFDRYAYNFGGRRLGESAVDLSVDVTPPAPQQIMPAVVGRRGLDLEPRDLTDADVATALAALIGPDQAGHMERYRRAVELLSRDGAPDLRQGAVEDDLLGVLTEAYDEMPPGNTIFLFDVLLWPYLADDQKERAVWAIQRLAGHLQPHKPMAWLQVEPIGQGRLELRLHTFGWADPEDREVRRIAVADGAVTRIDWME